MRDTQQDYTSQLLLSEKTREMEYRFVLEDLHKLAYMYNTYLWCLPLIFLFMQCLHSVYLTSLENRVRKIEEKLQMKSVEY